MQLGQDAVILARWSEEIHDEWMRNVLAHHPNVARNALERTRQAMDEAIWDALVVGFERLQPGSSFRRQVHSGADDGVWSE